MKPLWIVSLFFLSLTAYNQDFAIRQLESSPRHHEWVHVKSGNRQVHCFVAYPEVAHKTPGVIIIHENRGLTDWVRSFADQLAASGYLAIAPDLLSDFSPGLENTAAFENSDKAREAIYKLDPAQVMADLFAVQQFIRIEKSCNGKTATIGFCWGGSQSFKFATMNDQISAALVFYGSAPEKMEDVQRITAPVYGFYGENDERINAGIPAIVELMKQSDKKFYHSVYPGAGHAYMRAGDDPAGSEANKSARDESWKRLIGILSGL